MFIATVFHGLIPILSGEFCRIIQLPDIKRYLVWFPLWHSARFLRTVRLWWQQNLILQRLKGF